MVDAGIIGFDGEDKFKFLQILSQYLEKHYIRSVQTKAHFICLPTELYYHIRNTPLNSKLLELLPITGTYIIQNSENHNQIRFFIQNSIQRYTNHLLFSEIGDFAAICNVQIVLFSARYPIHEQLNAIRIPNFSAKKYLIFITHTQDIERDKKKAMLNQIKDEIIHFLANRKIHSFKIYDFPPLAISIHPEHNRWIIDLFQQCNESVMIEEKAHNDHIFKIVALHASAVGSSSFINRLYTKQYSPDISPTRGIDIQIVTRTKGSQKIILQIFDTSGKERFSFLIQNFLNYTKAIFLIYDLNQPETMDVAKNWLDILRNRSEFNSHPVPIILIGTKKDEINENSSVPSREWVADYPEISAFFPISSKTGENVEECLNMLIDKLIQHYHIFIPELTFENTSRYSLELEKMPVFRVFSKVTNQLAPHFNENPKDWYKKLTNELYNIPIVEQEFLLNALLTSSDFISKAFGLSLIAYIKHQWDPLILQYIPEMMNSSTNTQYLLLNSIKIYLSYNLEQVSSNINTIKEIYQLNRLNHRNYTEIIVNRFSDVKWIRLLTLWVEKFLFSTENPLDQDFEEQLLIELLEIFQTRIFGGNKLHNALQYLLFHPNLEIEELAFSSLLNIYSEKYRGLNKAQIVDHFIDTQKKNILERLAKALKNANYQTKAHIIDQIGILHQPEGIDILFSGFIYCPTTLYPRICQGLYNLSPTQFPPNNSYPMNLNLLSPTQQIQIRESAELHLVHPEESYRTNAMHLLYNLADPLSEHALICALTDVKESIRLLAVNALVQIKAWTAIVPLIECYVNSSSALLEGEILSSLTKLDPIRFPQGIGIEKIIRNLNSDEYETLITRLLVKFEKNENELPKLSLIRFFSHFNDTRVLELLIQCLRNQTIRVQHAATQSLQIILERPPDKGLRKTEEINIILQAMENYAFFTRFDIQNFLHHFSWRDIFKAVLYHPIPENQHILSVLQSRWQMIKLPLLYELRKKSVKAIFQDIVSSSYIDESEYNTYLAYLSLSYPNSLEELTLLFQTNKNNLNLHQQLRIKNIMLEITNQFQGTRNEDTESNENNPQILL